MRRQPAYINFILFLCIFLYERCFYACFLFRQPSASQHSTAYRLQAAVPEDMWASMTGVYEGNTPLPIYDINYKYFKVMFYTLV